MGLPAFIFRLQAKDRKSEGRQEFPVWSRSSGFQRRLPDSTPARSSGEPYAAAVFRRFPGTRGALKRVPEKRRGNGGLFRPSQALRRLRLALMLLFLKYFPRKETTSMNQLFDSRDPFHRRPVGAVEEEDSF